MIIRPPGVEPYSQLQLRFCRRGASASVEQEVHLVRYFAVGLKLLYLGVLGEDEFWRPAL